jgi:hypothetical protein
MFETHQRWPIGFMILLLLGVLSPMDSRAQVGESTDSGLKYLPSANQSHQAGISVASGTYGGNCGGPEANVTAHLASACNGKSSCEYSIDYTVIGDPIPGCAKDYVAKWTCSGSAEQQTARAAAEAGYGSKVLLKCAPDFDVGKAAGAYQLQAPAVPSSPSQNVAFDSQSQPPISAARSYYGLYRATVVDAQDPTQRGRVKVVVPDLLSDSPVWAMPCFPYIDNVQNGRVTPPVGAHVWIQFEKGDPGNPVWMGWLGDDNR